LLLKNVLLIFTEYSSNPKRGCNMNELVQKIGQCVEHGKVNKVSPFPADMKGLDGADEFTKQAIEAGIGPEVILQACNDGMQRIGEKFGRNEVFIPELLMAAKAMQVVMAHLKPFFKSGAVKPKGKFVLGTVAGDLHDIGKNLVSMIVEGNGWEVIDLGVDVKPNRFLQTIGENPGCVVGLSSLLTTAMTNMADTIKQIKNCYSDVRIIVGGAPLTEKIAVEMGADGYARDPQNAVDWLNSIGKIS
jgi:5-methyltetrahydrofolate--homocysteine methyltransferase